jgi:DNA primase
MSREVEEIKSRLDIVDLIGQYVKLTPAGANYKACCPFHNEKTPSMMINREKQIWRCFGCGEGGDAFTFLMKIEGLDFPEALKILAQKTGVVLERHDAKEESRKSRLYDLCDLTAKYWHKVLLASSQAKEVRGYVERRGLSEESVDYFRLGYSIDSWDDVINFLKKKGFNDDEIFEAGLSVKKTSGYGYYDRFRGRLMFPILDLSGRVVGFGGRTLNKDESAKYINSPQTQIYNKSTVLYGFYWAREAIKKADNCILVEGYMDTLPSHQMGVKNVAAISGTALTIEQIKILKRYSNNLSLALDMDAAGQMAASRSIDLALREEMNVKVITVPHGKDPGECIQNNPDDWIASIKSARPVMEYFFDKEMTGKDVSRPEEKKKIAAALINQIKKLGSKVEEDYWLKELAKQLDISENILRELAAKGSRENPTRKNNPVESQASAPVSSLEENVFKRILAIIFVEPKLLKQVVEILPVNFTENEQLSTLYKNFVIFYNKSIDLLEGNGLEGGSQPDLFDLFHDWAQKDNILVDEKTASLLAEAFLLSQRDFLSLDSREIKAEFEICLKTLTEKNLDRQMVELNSALKRAEKTGDKVEMEKILSKLSGLVGQKAKK